MEFTVAQFGSVDGLVNNASTGGALTPLLDTDVEDWDRTQDLVLRSVFLGIKHAAKNDDPTRHRRQYRQYGFNRSLFRWCRRSILFFWKGRCVEFDEVCRRSIGGR